MKLISLFLTVMSSIAPAYAASEKPMDFAKGFEVTLSGAGPIFNLQVPDALYEGVVSAEMQDIALFNSNGDLVPFEILGRDQLRLVKPIPNVYESIDYSEVQSAPSLASTQVVKLQTDTVGKVNGINIEESSKPQGKVSSSYVIDLRNSDRQLENLKFDWEGKKDGTFIPVLVEESENLNDWRLIGSGTLVEVADQKLSQTSFDVAARPKTALRITLRVAPEIATLKSLAAAFHTPNSTSDEPLPSTKVVFARSENGAIVYDTQGFFPVGSVQVMIGTNSASVVAISSSMSDKGPWTPRANATIFDYSGSDVGLRSKPITFEQTRDRYWKLDFLGAGEKFLQNPPGLEIAWYPERIVFVQNGNSPYQLAYGSLAVKSRLAGAGNLRDQVIEQLKKDVQLSEAFIGNPLTLGGPEKLQPKPEDAWRKFLLPGVLVIAVLLIAHQAWKMVREMSTKPQA